MDVSNPWIEAVEFEGMGRSGSNNPVIEMALPGECALCDSPLPVLPSSFWFSDAVPPWLLTHAPAIPGAAQQSSSVAMPWVVHQDGEPGPDNTVVSCLGLLQLMRGWGAPARQELPALLVIMKGAYPVCHQ